MKKLNIAVVLVLLLAIFGAGSAAAQPGVGVFGVVTMNAQNGSGQNGEVDLFDNGDGTTTVVVNITGGAAGVPQPAHIHDGTCANLNPKPLYPLSNVVDGKSTTTVKVSFDDLRKGTYAVNVHKSGPEAAVYVSCGDLTAMHVAARGAIVPGSTTSASVQLSAQNNSGQNGSAVLTDMGDGTTMVVLSITPGAAGVAQPAHIHEGTCANLNPKPLYPLSNVVDGKSTTTVKVSLADLSKADYAINVHKSGPEAAVYVSCGNIPRMTSGGTVAPGMPTTGDGGELTLLLALGALIIALFSGGVMLRRRA